MIRYAKGQAPRQLTALAATPRMDWDGLGAADRTPIRAALVRDQGWLCAYCQRRISADENAQTGRSQMKIEHWLPRNPAGSNPRAGTTDHHFLWSNLLGVCLGVSSDPGAPSVRISHCDTSRGNADLFLHPVDGQGPDPRDHLRYTHAGKVEPANPDSRVEADIRELNLNAPQLQRGRREALDEIRRRLERSGFATSDMKRIAHEYQISPGMRMPEHAESVRYYVLKKLRSRGEMT
jgi:uncharacterized protein (TIGR02646 family)